MLLCLCIFLTRYAASKRSIGVVTIGHAHHSRAAVSEHKLFTLQQQGTTQDTVSTNLATNSHALRTVDHKIAFLKMLVKARPDVKVVLVGHSVGAHICLEAIKALPPSNVLMTALLFPTVMHIGDSPNGAPTPPNLRPAHSRCLLNPYGPPYATGRKLAPVFRHMRGVVGCLTWLLACLPDRFAKTLVRWHSGRAVSASAALVQPKPAAQLLPPPTLT